MASAVEAILEDWPNESASFAELREEVPNYVHLSRADRAASLSRPSEQLWEQILRNIIAHERPGFVHVEGGIKLEWRGNARVTRSDKSRAHAP